MIEIATRVSIIIPCYNGERWIATAIESVLSQSYRALEVIVVDDGSRDHTANILKGFGSDITVITQPNAGVSAARNAGASLAAGFWLKFLDADDTLPDGALKHLSGVAELHPGKVVVGRAEVIDECGLPSVGEIDYSIGCRPETGTALNPYYLITQATHSSLWLIPRLLFTASGGFDPDIRLGEEFGFTIRLLQAGAQFVFLDQDVSYVRNHGGDRLSRAGNQDDYARLLRTIQGSVHYLSSVSAIPADARRRISRMCWSIGRHCAREKIGSISSDYFAYARRIAGNEAINGSVMYRVMARVLGGERAESVLENAKSAISGLK